jgi:hypothetical protein
MILEHIEKLKVALAGLITQIFLRKRACAQKTSHELLSYIGVLHSQSQCALRTLPKSRSLD